MSLRVARVAAVGIGFGALLGGLTATLWAQPLRDRLEPSWLSFVVYLLAFTVSLGVPVVVFSRFVCPLRLRPAAFQVDSEARRFVVGPFPRTAGTQAILLLWVGGNFIGSAARTSDGQLGFDDWQSAIVPVGLLGVIIAVAVATAFVRRATVVLDPAGITVQRIRHRVTISWDELAPGGPPPPTRAGSSLTLYRRGWHPEAGPPRTDELPVGMLNVRPAFLAGAIRRYAEQPQLRAGIGTPTELARLRADLPPEYGGGIAESGAESRQFV
ncbi:hypothetical protein [Plantactinospora soyae]|uniref:PH domain-containing protein n=1 Tax=Plantactinospora soyae TaxID=1544732 RepID=A0A927R2F0_9ACTN|nr:hypothetical protein [Plantactinospora soyae]MBE1484484.1 hypothetical protein [Plantactinospora soyae]